MKNALKFTQLGEITIFMAYDEAKQQLRVHVVDTGRGIKAEDKAKLFTLFGKLRRTAEINSEGIGMGLMICRDLVTINKGTIEVHSDGVDQGSTFSFTMEMKPAAAAPIDLVAPKMQR